LATEQDDIVLLLNFKAMSRLKQSQNIDRLIQSINLINENRCSLSDEDVKILDEASTILMNLKRKKGKTNKEIIKAIIDVVELLSKFFTK